MKVIEIMHITINNLDLRRHKLHAFVVLSDGVADIFHVAHFMVGMRFYQVDR